MLDRADLIKKIETALNHLHDKEQELDGCEAWTLAIKQELCQLGHTILSRSGKPLYVGAAGVSKSPVPICDGGEWLFDVCWLEYDQNGFLESIPLAAECEWGDDSDIEDDFQKLLVSRADLRVMVFGERNKDNRATADLLAKYVNHFISGSRDDAYFLAGYEGAARGFRYFVWDGHSSFVETVGE